MNYKKLKILLRIITAILAIFPNSIIYLFALFVARDNIRTGSFLSSALDILNFHGVILGFLGICLCIFNQYNYYTFAMLFLGTISLIILLQRVILANDGALILIWPLAIIIPNSILCLKNKAKKSNENAARDASHP